MTCSIISKLYKPYNWLESLSSHPRRKASLEESFAESHAYNPIRDSGEMLGKGEKSHQVSLPRVSPRLSVRHLARLLVRLFALAKRLPRVSDRIICMALRKTLSETCFLTRVFTVATLMMPSGSGWVAMIRPSFHCNGGRLSASIPTSFMRWLEVDCHLLRLVS